MSVESELAQKVAEQFTTNRKTRLTVLLAVFAVGMILGAGTMHSWYISDLRAELASTKTALNAEKNKPPQIKETVKTVVDTQLAYVPKETIIYKDPEKGPDAQEEQKELDGKFDFKKPEFFFTVNGRPGKFTKTDNEQYIFDKNMLQLQQSSIIKIEAEIPTIDKTKNGAIGIGYGTNGPAAKLDINKVWMYGDKDTKAGGIQYRF